MMVANANDAPGHDPAGVEVVIEGALHGVQIVALIWRGRRRGARPFSVRHLYTRYHAVAV